MSDSHTIGVGHCNSFMKRLYPAQDPSMDKTFVKWVNHTCPSEGVANTTVLGVQLSARFNNKYYVDLMNQHGVFTSNQDLFADQQARGIVTAFAVNESLFFERFVAAVVKMGPMSLLTGLQGEIRTNY